MAKQTTDAISQRRPSQGGGCLVLFGLFFLLIGSAAFYFAVLSPVLQISAARSWVATPCTITSSQVASSRGSKSTTYKVEVAYNYAFNGQNFTGDRYNFASGSSSGYSDKQAAVGTIPPGARVTCYVNPNSPSESVISRDMPRDTWFGLFTLIFVFAGIAICVMGLKTGRSEATPRGRTDWRPKNAPLGPDLGGATPFAGISSASQAASTSSSAPSPFQDISAMRERVTGVYNASTASADYRPYTGNSGPIVLKPRNSRLGMFIFLLIFAAFWNGVVWAGLFSGGRSSGGIFFSLFMIPFVLVGIGVAIGAVYQFLALFGPKLEVTASVPHVALGGTLDIAWTMKSGLQSATRMHLFLEGREEATYRRGTDTYTDKNTFAVIDITDLQSREAMRQGSARVTIPAHLMHSFEAPNNKILWLLVAKGEVPKWPDLKEEYPIAVLPQAVNL